MWVRDINGCLVNLSKVLHIHDHRDGCVVAEFGTLHGGYTVTLFAGTDEQCKGYLRELWTRLAPGQKVVL